MKLDGLLFVCSLVEDWFYMVINFVSFIKSKYAYKKYIYIYKREKERVDNNLYRERQIERKRMTRRIVEGSNGQPTKPVSFA